MPALHLSAFSIPSASVVNAAQGVGECDIHTAKSRLDYSPTMYGIGWVPLPV